VGYRSAADSGRNAAIPKLCAYATRSGLPKRTPKGRPNSSPCFQYADWITGSAGRIELSTELANAEFARTEPVPNVATHASHSHSHLQRSSAATRKRRGQSTRRSFRRPVHGLTQGYLSTKCSVCWHKRWAQRTRPQVISRPLSTSAGWVATDQRPAGWLRTTPPSCADGPILATMKARSLSAARPLPSAVISGCRRLPSGS
jgi:hypothetical protein